MPREGRIQRAGWWGMSILLGAAFFAVGAFVSLLNGEFGLALQGSIVTLALIALFLYLMRRRVGGRTSRS